MNEEFKKIEQSLERVQPSTLSLTQKEALWSRIESHLGEVYEVPIESPYMIFSSVMHMRVLVPALLVILIVSTGATTALADSARPGDFLFAVDRAAERMRLSIVSETKKDDVRVAIADERVEELESLISDESSRRLARGATTEGVARAGNTRNTKQAGAPEAEMALFATQVAMDADATLDTGTDDSIHVPENPRPEDVMMAKNAGEPVGEGVQADVYEEKDNRDDEIFERNKDIEAALALVEDISLELKEKGNTEAYDAVQKSVERLTHKLEELPLPEADGVLRETIEDLIPFEYQLPSEEEFDWDTYKNSEVFKSTTGFNGQDLKSVSITYKENPAVLISVQFSDGAEELSIAKFPPMDGVTEMLTDAVANRYAVSTKEVVSVLSVGGNENPRSPYTGKTYKEEYGVEIDSNSILKIEVGEVRGDSIEIETEPHIEVSRPEKDR